MPNYILTTNGVLAHHGIKGQKWGVRRFQNRDGSLTPAGKKRVEEGANLFPKYNGEKLKWKSERSLNRDTTVENIEKAKRDAEDREYEEYIKKHPEFDKDMRSAKDYWRANLRDKNKAAADREALINRFLDEYANATLKDLDMEATTEAKRYTEELLRKRRVYDGIV